MHLLIIVIVLVFIFCQRSQKDPFRYIWSLSHLEKKYLELQQNESSSIKTLYQQALLRIEEGKRKSNWFSNRFFTEVEYVMRTRRSLDVLRKRTWEYAKELAQVYGYDEDEIGKEDFFCPGWNELWELYHKHKERILSKKNYEKPPKWQWAGSEAFGSSSSNESTSNSNPKNQRSERRETNAEKVKSKNQSLFDGICDLKELKKKYFRLAKLNHPDQGGSDEAMKLLNQYYQEAFQRILAREDS